MEKQRYMVGNLVNSYKVIGKENEDLEYVFEKQGEPILSVITNVGIGNSHAALLEGKKEDNVLYIHEPIKLTNEILFLLGFKSFGKDFIKNGIIIHNRKRGFVVNKKIPIIESVHQLQNLYFALTGQELQYVDK